MPLKRLQQGVERVDAELRPRRGVRGLAEIGDLHARRADGARMGDVVHAGIDQHHRVDAVEEALAVQDVLAAAALLARRAERHGGAAELRRSTLARPMAAPTPAAATTLWPQLWP